MAGSYDNEGGRKSPRPNAKSPAESVELPRRQASKPPPPEDREELTEPVPVPVEDDHTLIDGKAPAAVELPYLETVVASVGPAPASRDTDEIPSIMPGGRETGDDLDGWEDSLSRSYANSPVGLNTDYHSGSYEDSMSGSYEDSLETSWEDSYSDSRPYAVVNGYKQALPLPAPPLQQLDAPGPKERQSPDRLTLAGSKVGLEKQRAQKQTPSQGHRVPPARLTTAPRRMIDEEIDRSTAVATDPLAPLRVPLINNRYRIVERIGAGGMGKVFKVTHAHLGKTFALKVISDNVARDDRARDLFYREARMASSLSHPNIATVVDFGEDEKLGVFMVMEFVQGEPLSKMLSREGRLSMRQTAELIAQVADALDYIHRRGIVHCDIKTENILLTEIPGAKRRKLQVKLLDFGLARSIVGGRNTISLAGTPHYVAPERLRGAQPSPSTDIYSLGILAYELVTGTVPWDGAVDAILTGHLELEPTPPSQRAEGLDPAFEQLVLRALAKSPADRHKDVAAFSYELQTVMDMLGYGRRGKRGARRVVVERRTSRRDEIARALFDASRVPMALLSRTGEILLANPAFAQFTMGVAADVEGRNVHSSPLVHVWPDFAAELDRACDGTGTRRIVDVDGQGGRTRKLLMWLDPGLKDDQAIFGVHPLDG